MAEKNSKGMENITLVNKNYSESVPSFIESDLSDRGRSDIMKERTDHGTVKKNDQTAWSSTGYEHSYTKKSTTTGKNSRGKIVEEDEKHNPTLPCFTDHDLHQNHDTYKRMEEGSELERTQQMIPTSEKSNESEGKEKCKEGFISSTDSHNAATWSERKSGGKAFGFQVDKKDNVGVPSLDFDSSIVNDCAVPEQVTSAANEKEGERVSLEQEIQNDEKSNEEATETCESEPPNEFHTLCERIIVKEGKTEDGSSIVDSSSVDAGEIGQKNILLEINQEHKEGEKTSRSYGVSLTPDTEPSAKFASETYSSEKELKRNWEIKKILADTVTKTTEANSQDLICGTFSGIPNLWTIKDFIVSKFANSSEDEVRRDASGSSSVNETRKQNYESSKQFSHNHASLLNRDIKTLDDALQYFGLTLRLSNLEKSLEELRRRKKTKEEHERDLKQIDKEMQKLSFRFHPDRVKNRGGSDEEIASAQKLQTALNATRMVLTILNEAFMEDLSADHKYSFYTKLNIGSLANEDKIRNHVYEVLFKIGLISEIKQQKIIAEIRKFLIESKSCIQSYFGDKVNDFEKHRNAVMSHLRYCIKGYKKLRAEFEAVEKECKLEKLDNIHSSIQRMANESLAELTILRKLRKIAKHSLAGSFQIFVPFQHMDDYFVLPLVCYVNVILLCNAVIKNDYQSFEGHIPPCPWGQFDNTVGNQLYFLKYPYHLVLYLSNNIECKRIARRTLVQGNLSGDEAKQQFNDSLHPINVYLEDNFKVGNYAEGSTRGRLIEELKKCMTMMSEFKEKKQELSEDIEKFNRKAEEMDEKYEKIMKKTEELNRKVKERLEQSRKLSEKTSLALSEKI